MNAISLLKQDHSEVKALFEEYEGLRDDGEAREEKEQVAERIIRELSVHAAIEEQILYPFAKERDRELEGLVAESLEEHSVAKWELSALDRMRIGHERYDAKMSVLMETMRHHIHVEETQLFPRLSQRCSDEELEDLGDKLRDAKLTAPTHAHPRAPDEPPGNLMTPFLAALDRGRDLANEGMERAQHFFGRLFRRGRRVVRGQQRRLSELRHEGVKMTRKASRKTAQVAQQAGRRLERTAESVGERAGTVQRRTASAARQARATGKGAARQTSKTARKTVRRAGTAPKRRSAPKKKQGGSSSSRKKQKQGSSASKRA